MEPFPSHRVLFRATLPLAYGRREGPLGLFRQIALPHRTQRRQAHTGPRKTRAPSKPYRPRHPKERACWERSEERRVGKESWGRGTEGYCVNEWISGV